MTKEPRAEPTSSNNTPDRWLAARILAGKQLLAGAFWASWFALTWLLLLGIIEASLSVGAVAVMFLVGAAVVSNW